MMFVLSALAFFVLLTLLVLIHEFGHYAVARWMGVSVEEFGFGLPPRAKVLFTLRGTIFSLNTIPFGGFVRLRGEASVDPLERNRPGSFTAASIPARLGILVAGVVMNFLLAVVILSSGFALWRWVPTYLSLDSLEAGAARGEVDVTWNLYVSEVVEGSKAEEAGVLSDAILAAVNGIPVTKVGEVLELQTGTSSVEYTLRTGKEFTEEKRVSVTVENGKTGVALSEFASMIRGRRHSLLEAVRLSFRETWTVMVQTVQGAGKLLTSVLLQGKVPKGITGIVGIAQLTHASIQEGFLTYLRLVALLSLSLAALNVLPFPALDGGRILFVLVEMLTGRPMHRRFEIITNALGFAVILALITVVTLNDLFHLFSPAQYP